MQITKLINICNAHVEWRVRYLVARLGTDKRGSARGDRLNATTCSPSIVTLPLELALSTCAPSEKERDRNRLSTQNITI